MNKYQNQIRILFQALKRQIRQHSDVIASTACGLVMGLLFLSFLTTQEAKQIAVRVGTKHVEVTSQLVDSVSSESSSSESSESSVSSEASSSSLTISSSSSVSSSVKPRVIVPASVRPAAPVSSEASSEPVASSEAASSIAPIIPSSSSSSSASSIAVSSVSSSASVSSSTSSAVSSSAPTAVSGFPAFDHTSWPVGKTPNWGAMSTPAEWNRTYSQMTTADFVGIPRYDMKTLTTPMSTLTNPKTEENIPAITAKLFYSTRYLGKYDLDAGEHTGQHAGVDLKLARGTGIGAIGGGRVASVSTTQTLGLHVIIEHRLKNGETYYSIYGHFDSATVSVGQDVKPGQLIGYVGMTGNTAAPHVHLQIDVGTPGGNHTPWVSGEPESGMVNPITFLGKWRNGE